MTYDPDKRYRCTIIRGKSKRKMDNLLPAYAGIISNICPCLKKEFDKAFNDKLSLLIYNVTFEQLSVKHKKTIRNHITEIAGKLLGLYWVEDNFVSESESSSKLRKDTFVSESESSSKLLEDNDQPAFFKNLCLNFQFPNGSQKIKTIIKRINDKICFKPFHFLVTLLSLAQEESLELTIAEISYYVLASHDVLQGSVSPLQVIKVIRDRRKLGIQRILPPGSREKQHIKEQLNLLELANIIRIVGGVILLNFQEREVINLFQKEYNTPLSFNISLSDLNTTDGRNSIYSKWSRYYGEIHVSEKLLITSLESLQDNSVAAIVDNGNEESANRIELGDAGELLVFQMEKTRVKRTHPSLENKVLLLSKQRGLGYDIASIEAEENTEDPEFARFIEVKLTKRSTLPTLDDTSWIDTINLTRKEWVAAKQHRGSYNIYRVYFTPASTVVRKIIDPFSKNENCVIKVLPTMYRMDFRNSDIDKEYNTNEIS